MDASPVVSVVVPVYNCADYFSECIDSLLKQTLSNFEIIIVDDGSVDGTFELARKYETKYEFIHLYSQDHKYAGEARNEGIRRSRGKYLIFLDGDDLFERDLLLHASMRMDETHADVCVFGAGYLNNQTGEITYTRSSFNVSICPRIKVFNRVSNPRYIFNFTTPAPWTKMFRRDFVVENGLWFQNTRSANDLRFVFTSLAIAKSITILDEFLVIYRQKQSSSLQATQHKDPFSFYHALIGLRDELDSRGVLDSIAPAFHNVAMVNCVYNVHSLSDHPLEQKTLFDFLHSEGLRELGIADKPSSYFYLHSASRLRDFSILQRGSFEEFITAETSATVGAEGKTAMKSIKSRIRKLIPLRASVFEKSRKELESDLASLRHEVESLAEQNRNISDKLSACIMEMNKRIDE